MRQRLFVNWRGVSIVLMALVGAGAAASTGPGYLRRVGPDPLRFLTVFQRPTNQVVLPAPIPMPEPARVIAEPEKPSPPPPQPPPSAPKPAATAPAQTQMDTAPADGVVSPQMFLKFFSKPATNSAPAGNGAAGSGPAQSDNPPTP